jgi:hypothetical protein
VRASCSVSRRLQRRDTWYCFATLSTALSLVFFVAAVFMAQLQLLLDQRNCWQQSIKLELFQGSKDIFRDSVPVDASRKQEFMVAKESCYASSLS